MLLLARRGGLDSLSVPVRASQWGLMTVLVACFLPPGDAGLRTFGLRMPTGSTLVWAVMACALSLVASPVAMWFQKRASGAAAGPPALFDKIAGLSLGRRIFIVATASVVEEVLYRGYAIGAGRAVLGGVVPAAVLSLAVFVMAHFRGGAGHLSSVFWAGGVLTLLFIITNDLVACILAHAVLDAIGLIVAPVLLQRAGQRKRAEGA
ncbi:MAG: CPBP family intramembrane metalloprotease [Pseudomonadota bacterium]|nr:CPBP family intramembrane metalloprotease [Pseudomonadota bacterium]